MPTEQPAKKSRLSSPLMLFAASVLLVLLGIGLCSAGGVNFESSNTTVTTQIGTIAFLLGVAGVPISILWGIIALIVGVVDKPSPPPPPEPPQEGRE